MPGNEWFRRKTWTQRDRAEFYDRLKRSRGNFNKAQYTRIQAYHLAEEGEINGAIELLKLLFAEFPERSELSPAHLQMGDCFLALGNTDAALDEYRAALEAEKLSSNVRTGVWIKFPWLVAVRGMRHLYSEAREFLDWGGRRATFPIEEFRLATVEAFMAADEQKADVARRFARIALAAAKKTNSGFRYHPKLGLVDHTLSEVEETLEKLAQ